jgi:hypothetical protein
MIPPYKGFNKPAIPQKEWGIAGSLFLQCHFCIAFAVPTFYKPISALHLRFALFTKPFRSLRCESVIIAKSFLHCICALQFLQSHFVGYAACL